MNEHVDVARSAHRSVTAPRVHLLNGGASVHEANERRQSSFRRHDAGARTRMNATAMLLKVARRLREDDDDDLAEFAAVIERVLAGDEPSLDRAIGLCVPSQRSIETQAFLIRRNELLRRLAADHFPDLSTHAAATELHRIWRRYASSAWPRERNSATMPVHRIEKPEFAFWQIMKLQDRVLAERSIRRILAMS